MATVYAGAGTAAARVAGEDPEMDRVADAMSAAIVRVAARHRRTGQYIGSRKVARVRGKRGVTDRMVTVEDPASVHIEWGHALSGNRASGSPGPARWVRGLRIVSTAYRQVR